MKKQSSGGKRSTSEKVAAFKGINKAVPVPAGVELKTEAELEAWKQFTRARAVRDWREVDLLMLSKAAKLEVKINELWQMLDAEGLFVESNKGAKVDHPACKVLDTLQRQQMQILGKLHVLQTTDGVNATTINNRGKEEEQARQLLSGKKSAVSLLAQPED
jgi:hypothetical protein